MSLLQLFSVMYRFVVLLFFNLTVASFDTIGLVPLNASEVAETVS
jgi:hypothetical protein